MTIWRRKSSSSSSNFANSSLQICTLCSFIWGVSILGTHRAEIFLYPRKFVMMWWTLSWEIPFSILMSICLTRRFSQTNWSTRDWCLESGADNGRPVRAWSWTVYSLGFSSLERGVHLLTVLTSKQISPYTVFIREWISIGLKPSVVRNSITALCFKRRSMEDAIFLSSDRVTPPSLMTHHILSSNDVIRRCNFAHM